MSAANSLQFNQLIGGAISPSVISQQNGSASTQAGSTSSVVSPTTQNQHLMIGDYVQGMSNVISSSPFRQQWKKAVFENFSGSALI